MQVNHHGVLLPKHKSWWCPLTKHKSWWCTLTKT